MPRFTLTLTLTLTVALTLLATPGLAQVDQLLAAIDANGDGSISRDEVLAVREALFDRMDTDGNGTLSRAEVEAARALAADRRAMQAARDPWTLDANGDNALGRDEFTAATPGFDRADRNGDGVLSPDEIDRVARLLGSLGAGLN